MSSRPKITPTTCSLVSFKLALDMDTFLMDLKEKKYDSGEIKALKEKLVNTLSDYNSCFDDAPELYNDIMDTMAELDLYNINNVRTNSPINDAFHGIRIV